MSTAARPHPLALAALLAANLLPLAGVLFLDWDLALVLYLFWAESAVIGFFAILKLPWVAGWGALFLVPFFCLHFGIFMAGHQAFLRGMVGEGMSTAFLALPRGIFERMQPHWAVCLGSLVASHGISFVVHFLRPRAWRGLTFTRVMATPYKRVVIMHVTILAGGALSQALGTPLWALGLLVVLKVALDVVAHRKEHGAAGLLGIGGG